jgi:hypothetical protein
MVEAPLLLTLSGGANFIVAQMLEDAPLFPSSIEPAEAEHVLTYGTGANKFRVGSAAASTEAVYVGTHTVIKPEEEAETPQLTLDLYASLHIASDFLYEAVYSNWDTRNVAIVARPVPESACDQQAVELSGQLNSYAGDPVIFDDVACKGAFATLTLPDAEGAPTVAPTAMRNLHDNWHYAPSWEVARFKSVTIGAGRTLDFYQGEGFIYTASLAISPTAEVRYWPYGGEPIIVTEYTTPALDDLIVLAVATIYGDWNGDCVISNVELAQLQAAVAGGSRTYDPLMDCNCDGVLNNVELAKFLGNMTVQPPCGGRDGGGEGGEGEGEGDGWAFEEDGGDGWAFDGEGDGGAEEEEGAGEGSGGEDGVDVAELAEWIMAELSPEELAVFVADLAAAAEEFAGTPAGADMAALLAELE